MMLEYAAFVCWHAILTVLQKPARQASAPVVVGRTVCTHCDASRFAEPRRQTGREELAGNNRLKGSLV